MAENKKLLTLLTEFAEFLGQQDKEILATIDEKIAQLKQDLLGGDVAADLDTLKELADAVRNFKASDEMPEKLISKITDFKNELDAVVNQLTELNGVDLKQAYNKGKLGV